MLIFDILINNYLFNLNNLKLIIHLYLITINHYNLVIKLILILLFLKKIFHIKYN